MNRLCSFSLFSGARARARVAQGHTSLVYSVYRSSIAPVTSTSASVGKPTPTYGSCSPRHRIVPRHMRRKPDGPPPPEVDLKDIARQTMVKVEKALISGMKEANVGAVFDVDTWDDAIDVDLGPSVGIYQVRYHDDQRVLELQSPKSGTYVYLWDELTGKWVGSKDGHDFEGMLTRDIIQQVKGVPEWD